MEVFALQGSDLLSVGHLVAVGNQADGSCDKT